MTRDARGSLGGFCGRRFAACRGERGRGRYRELRVLVGDVHVRNTIRLDRQTRWVETGRARCRPARHGEGAFHALCAQLSAQWRHSSAHCLSSGHRPSRRTRAAHARHASAHARQMT